MRSALRHFRLSIARLILSAKGDDRPAADVFNHEEALLGAAWHWASSEAIEWALDTCIAEATPGRPFGGLNLAWNVDGQTLLYSCAERGSVSLRIAQLLRHQLMER